MKLRSAVCAILATLAIGCGESSSPTPLTTPTPTSSCSYGLSPSTQEVPVGGGTFATTITTTSACSWTTTADSSWIVISSGSSGTTTGPITYSVPANPGDVRKGSIAARANGGAAVTLTITQDGVARFALAGVVRQGGPNGTPIVGARVQILDDSGAFRITDYNGAFVFPGIPAGRMLFEVTKDGYQAWEDEIMFDSDTQLAIALSPTS